MSSDTIARLGRKLGQRVVPVQAPTTGVVAQVTPTEGRVVVQVDGLADTKPMRYSAGFGRDLADLGRAMEGRPVKVSFLESGEPIVDYLIIGDPITDFAVEF